MWKKLYRIVVGIAVCILLVRGIDWTVRHSQTLPPVPQPNGYDALLEAGRRIVKPPTELTYLTPEQIRELAEKNRAAVKKALLALDSQVRVPLQARPGWLDKHEEDLKSLKQLAVAMGIEARAQAPEGQTNIQASIEIIRLGQACCHGGVILDGITGVTLEAVGWGTISSLLPQLDAAQCRKAVQTLEELESRRETADQIVETEKTWSTATYGLIHQIGKLTMRKSIVKRSDDFAKRYQECCERTVRLKVKLAERAYELETGKGVTNLAELVPGYLKAIPVNQKD